MNKIDVNHILKSYNLNKKEVAAHLFPKNTYPALALNRVISGDSNLDSEQISKLALLANITISDLYGIKFTAKSTDRCLFFEYEDFSAVLNTDSWITRVFHKNSLFHESVIHKSTIALSEYLDELRSIINKYKNDEHN